VDPHTEQAILGRTDKLKFSNSLPN